MLLTTFGLALVVAGLAEWTQLSAAIAAFLLGIAMSEPLADRARALLGPLRDLFAAIVIAGQGVAAGVEPALWPLSAAYVLILAGAAPLIMRHVDVAATPFVRARRPA